MFINVEQETGQVSSAAMSSASAPTSGAAGTIPTSTGSHPTTTASAAVRARGGYIGITAAVFAVVAFLV